MDLTERERKRLLVYEDEIYEYFTSSCKEDLLKILKERNPSNHYSIIVRHYDFSMSCPKSNKILTHSADKVFLAGDQAARRALFEIYDKTTANQRKDLVLKKHVHLRIHSRSFPKRSPFYKHSFPGAKEVGLFIGLVGTVVRTSVVKPLEYKRAYRCNKCKQITMFEAPASRSYAFPKVIDKCQNLCNGARVEDVSQRGESSGCDIPDLKNYQEIKVQEKDPCMDFTANTKAYWVLLEDDLVDSCKPGDDVVVSGTMFRRWERFRTNRDLDGEICFKANHLEVINDDSSEVTVNNSTIKSINSFWNKHVGNPFLARNIIIRSFCPEIYGMYIVKLALSVVLAGGVSKVNGGSKVRGESHLLLVGDPGTGKSQLLKYASKLTPRSVLTNGLGITSAGLTVTAVKDSDDWHLEAGALVLADRGVCCIDEFSNMKDHDRVSIHEAMEQQSISVAKAGIVSNLSTKCSVLAATNPKFTKYDYAESPEVNIGLPSPLLSRFDLVMVLRDSESDAWDELLGKFIVKGGEAIETVTTNARRAGSIWDREMLQRYFLLIKDKRPEMSPEAEEILGAYYELQRKSTNRDVARTTVRFLESLFRLAEGHARLMYRDRVIVHDAISAITLMEASMQGSALIKMPNVIHISFPENPLEEYYNQVQLILGPSLLNLEKILDDEMLYLKSLKANFKCSNPPSSPPRSRENEQKLPPKEEESLVKNETRQEWFKSVDSPFKSQHSGDGKIVTSTQNSAAPHTPQRFCEEDGETLRISPISRPSNETVTTVGLLTPKQSLSTSSFGKENKGSPLESKISQGELKRKRASESPVPEVGETEEKVTELPKESSVPVKRKRFDLSRFKREDD